MTGVKKLDFGCLLVRCVFLGQLCVHGFEQRTNEHCPLYTQDSTVLFICSTHILPTRSTLIWSLYYSGHSDRRREEITCDRRKGMCAPSGQSVRAAILVEGKTVVSVLAVKLHDFNHQPKRVSCRAPNGYVINKTEEILCETFLRKSKAVIPKCSVVASSNKLSLVVRCLEIAPYCLVFDQGRSSIMPSLPYAQAAPHYNVMLSICEKNKLSSHRIIYKNKLDGKSSTERHQNEKTPRLLRKRSSTGISPNARYNCSSTTGDYCCFKPTNGYVTVECDNGVLNCNRVDKTLTFAVNDSDLNNGHYCTCNKICSNNMTTTKKLDIHAFGLYVLASVLGIISFIFVAGTCMMVCKHGSNLYYYYSQHSWKYINETRVDSNGPRTSTPSRAPPLPPPRLPPRQRNQDAANGDLASSSDQNFDLPCYDDTTEASEQWEDMDLSQAAQDVNPKTPQPIEHEPRCSEDGYLLPRTFTSPAFQYGESMAETSFNVTLFSRSYSDESDDEYIDNLVDQILPPLPCRKPSDKI